MTNQFFYACIQCILQPQRTIIPPNDLDAEEFQKYISHHRLQLIFLSLSHQGLLQNYFMQNNPHKHILKQLMFKKHLLLIIHALQKSNIAYVVLKGVPLNQQLYENQCLRISKDIDLLIHSEKLELTHHHLMALGYQLCSEFTPEMLAKQHKKIYGAIKDLTYEHPQHGVQIELHWDTTITPQFGFQFSDIECSRKTIIIDKTPIHILNDEHNFVYLCIHGSISHWQRIQWLIDVGLFAQKYTLSWKEIIIIAQKHHALRCVFEAQQLLQFFGVCLPQVPVNRRDKASVFIHKLYIRFLWRTAKSPHVSIEQLLQLFIYPLFTQKINYLLNRLLFRYPCRQKLLKDPDYPLWKLFMIGLFSKEKAPTYAPSSKETRC